MGGGGGGGGLPLRGAARWREGGGCFGGSSRCAGLLDRGREEAALGGAPAARGCSMERGRRLIWGELPLRGAARWRERGGCFGGSSRCVGLLDGEREEAALGGAPAARGCLIEGERSLFLGELPLRGASQLKEGEGSFWGGCRCAGLLDRGWEEATLGELPLRGAA